MADLKEELKAFLVHIMDERVDKYGHLEVCKIGDDLDPTVDRVVDDYLTERNKNKSNEATN